MHNLSIEILFLNFVSLSVKCDICLWIYLGDIVCRSLRLVSGCVKRFCLFILGTFFMLNLTLNQLNLDVLAHANTIFFSFCIHFVVSRVF